MEIEIQLQPFSSSPMKIARPPSKLGNLWVYIFVGILVYTYFFFILQDNQGSVFKI